MASTQKSVPAKPKPAAVNGSVKKTRNTTPIPPYDFGADITEAIHRFDGPGPHEKVVFACFVAGAKQQWAEYLRKEEASRLRKLTDSEIQEMREVWKPTAKRRGLHAVAKAEKIIGKLSADERAALLAALQPE